jgi:hypothetical protein
MSAVSTPNTFRSKADSFLVQVTEVVNIAIVSRPYEAADLGVLLADLIQR